jgi:hypothetical protein
LGVGSSPKFSRPSCISGGSEKSDEHRKAAQFFFFPSASAGSLACVIVRRAVPAIPGTILSLSCVRVCGGKARALTIDKEVLGKAEEV